MNLNVVILAAGRGKRMNSLVPKVLHEVSGRPMLQYAVDAVKTLKPQKTVVIIGNGAEAVKKRMKAEDHLSFVIQKKLLGTGDALAIARKELKKGSVLVLNGDCPLITTGTLKMLLNKHKSDQNMLSFLSFVDNSISGYGRIVRNENGSVVRIVEDKHATPIEKKRFNELNGGVYIMETEVLGYLNKIRKNSFSGEYYLTDIVDIVAKAGKKLEAYNGPPEEIRGVNTREELFKISDMLRKRIIAKWMGKGVTFIDPDTSFVHPLVSIGKDTIIYPNTYLEGSSKIGNNCIVYPGTRINNSILGVGVIIKDNTVIEESRIGGGTVIGPFAHLRPHSTIGRNVKIGNFVETKKSSIGDGTKASHLTYLGDAVVGRNVNIGAGTITCNYDGENKFNTIIESDVFIGSDSQLVAPVKIGKGAYVAAGATITKNVPAGSLAISRTKQQNLKGWAERKRKVQKSRSAIVRK
ncbi:MAG: bifunctional UDP-N-acetylglucosamine diphosphorylase/glucosamine-1-phosphate N-acetyltransferase GlmU [Nitrospirae bacterium]|nr:bifunctional UDP-N-acetylglucosamine diphosphorylase/glucosamine-1-phosphate N-acetyltransferase GlmU [Nitrospirota bacterium]